MRIKLPASLTRKLAALPESGMGYQRVDLVLSDGRVVHDTIVFNAEEADVPESSGQITITDVRPVSPGSG